VPAGLESDRVTAASTSGWPIAAASWPRNLLHLIDRIASATLTVSHPKLRACANRSSLRSPTMTTAAPSRNADVARPARPGRAGDVNRGAGRHAGADAPW
jgi:hypothetical protein